MRKISRATNFDSEIKKIKQELHHAQGMAKKWNEKVARREEKLFEVNRLAILDLCAKESMDYTQLRTVLENLPPASDIVSTPNMTETEMEELEEYLEESTQSQEEPEDNLDFEVDSSYSEVDFRELDKEKIEENKEELEQNDETMEQTEDRKPSI